MIKQSLSRQFTYKCQQFTVLQWNQLNSKLCDQKSFPKINPEFLIWNYRQNLLSKELLAFNADIICMEEVDQVIFYEEILKNQGYSLIKGQKFGGTQDWGVLAYKNSKFQLLDYKIQNYNEKNEKHSQFFIHAALKISFDKELWVFMTHLKAKDFEETRKIQTKELFENITMKYEIVKPEERKNIGIMVCGDFNAEPHYECMKELLNFFDSAYKDAEFTTFKFRDKLYARVIDYMLYSKESLKIIGKLEIPKKEDMDGKGLPNEDFPSDHLSLFGLFQFID